MITQIDDNDVFPPLEIYHLPFLGSDIDFRLPLKKAEFFHRLELVGPMFCEARFDNRTWAVIFDCGLLMDAPGVAGLFEEAKVGTLDVAEAANIMATVHLQHHTERHLATQWVILLARAVGSTQIAHAWCKHYDRRGQEI